MSHKNLALFIDNEWHSAGRETLPVHNPATEESLGDLPVATYEDVEQAVLAAARTFPIWRRTSVLDRSRLLQKTATVLRSRLQHIAEIITLELGKPLPEAQKEVHIAAEMFEWSAEECRRTYGRIIPARMPGVQQMVLLEPIGPVAAFSGWNGPLITPARKISGALAAGCTIVLKASEETPACAIEIAKALVDAGIPAGVVAIIFGNPSDISSQLLESPLIRGVTFTGSTSIGRSLAEHAAKSLKPVTLELGGHSPVLIYEDADLDSALDALIPGKFRNSGQVCVSPTRMYVQEGIYQEFTKRFVERASALKVGNGLDPTSQMGPLGNPRRLEAMAALTEDARTKGAHIATGGHRIGTKGWYWAPTVITDYDNNCDAANIEPFGPMALIRPFSTLNGAIEEANRLPFGLAAYVFSQNAKTINASIEAIESGCISVNHCQASLPETPFGGVKDSGIGREGGIEGLREFLQIKYVSQA